MAVKPKYVGAF